MRADHETDVPPPLARLRVAAIIATTGRPDVLPVVIDRLAGQTDPPDQVIISACEPADVGDIADLHPHVRVLFGRRGLCAQRNRGLDALSDAVDAFVFFDDDFVPSVHWMALLRELMADQPDIAAVTGRVLADGIHGQGIGVEDGKARMEAFDLELGARLDQERRGLRVIPTSAPYGCNMAFRRNRVADLRFDERLPLYGWQEDRDFGHFAGLRGRRVWASYLCGIHLGVKSGRTRGVRLGASQILNPLYMVGKGSMTRLTAARFMGSNFAANLLKSLGPERSVDRRGRLRGNLIALREVLQGRIDPEMVERL